MSEEKKSKKVVRTSEKPNQYTPYTKAYRVMLEKAPRKKDKKD